MQSEPPKADSSKHKRRWFQFSLRTLFVVVAIMGVQCGVCLPMLREWQVEQARVKVTLKEKLRLIGLALWNGPTKKYGRSAH
ncbi:MAG TPA: hypothetical protein VGY55_14755 [Pirellulales bacterium]|jgi:hypothetical protein|nr:hypothetical protein [Pirellulales bacterium]